MSGSSRYTSIVRSLVESPAETAASDPDIKSVGRKGNPRPPVNGRHGLRLSYTSAGLSVKSRPASFWFYRAVRRPKIAAQRARLLPGKFSRLRCTPGDRNTSSLCRSHPTHGSHRRRSPQTSGRPQKIHETSRFERSSSLKRPPQPEVGHAPEGAQC